MLTPGPDHPIAISQNPRRVRVLAAGHVIADSTDVRTLDEADLPSSQYFPRMDVERGFLSESPTVKECPYKGRATYYSMLIDGEMLEDIAWSYETPNPVAEDLGGRIAFDARRVEVYTVDDEDLRRHHHPDHRAAPPFADM